MHSYEGLPLHHLHVQFRERPVFRVAFPIEKIASFELEKLKLPNRDSLAQQRQKLLLTTAFRTSCKPTGNSAADKRPQTQAFADKRLLAPPAQCVSQLQGHFVVE
jgi:hypothetical protein